MRKKTKAESPEQSLGQALGQIASILTHTRISHPDFVQILQILCDRLSADAAVFFSKKYDESNSYHLENLGAWFTDDMLPSPNLDARDIPESIWVDMERKQITQSRNFIFTSSDNQSPLLFLPIFFGDHLSGFIVLLGVEQDRLSPNLGTFLGAFISIFELWISKMNEVKKFEDFIDFLPNPTMGVDINGIATIWNPAEERLTGWAASRILGKGEYEYALPFYNMRRPVCSNLILKPDPKWEATYMEYHKSGDVVHSQVFIPALTGAGVFLSGTIKRMRDINGCVYGAVHLIRDVTGERAVQSELHRSESMFKIITDYAGLGIALFRKEKSLYYNERFESLLGLSEKEIELMDLIQMISPEDREETRFRLDSMFKGTEKGPLRLDLQVKIRDCNRFYSSYAQVLDYEGNAAICFVLDDTTEQKQLAERARQNELKLYHEGRLTSLGIMAAGIAHELNQPLNTIRVVTDGFLFGREKGWALDLDELHESMAMVSKQVVRMSEVIENIRSFAREDREQKFIDVDVNQAIENVFFMIGRQFETHGIRVQKKLASGLPSVKVHFNRLEQVIMNLLVNARQALDACDRNCKEVWVNTGRKGESVYIEVVDNATGIPSDLIDKVFDPFFTTKEVGEGTGLGLSICKSIIREFMGSIEVFNNEHGGATFLIGLPSLGG